MEPAHHARQFAAEDWDWWHAGRQRVLARVLLPALAAQRRPGALALLDVGCGTGGTTAHLGRAVAKSRSGSTITGCDVAREALDCAAQRGGTRLVRASAEALPFAAGSFDVALVLDVLEHHDDDVAVAREVRRVLSPGGLFLATVPAFPFLWGPHDVLSHHRRRYRLAEFVRVLTAAGLRLVRATYFNTLLFPAVLAVQSLRRLLRQGRPVAPASDLPDRMPRALNALLRETFAAEGPWVARRSLPFGVSILALAAAPEATP